MMMSTPEDTWVNVTWMPHASLAQTSHVSLLVRSSHASLNNRLFDRQKPKEWKIRTTVHGAGGIPLVAISSTTPSAHVFLRQSETAAGVPKPPSVAEASHDCIWNHVVQVPVRWRDLPRDAYLLFEMIDHTGQRLSQAKMQFFSQHGRLSTGLILLDMVEDPSHQSNNSTTTNIPTESSDHEEDAVWKASMMLDKLESLESSRSGSLAATAADNRKVFGRVQSTSWLDAISKEYCHTVITSASKTTNSACDNNSAAKWKLIVEFPVFDVPVMHEESFYPVPQQSASGAVSALDLSLYRKSVAAAPDNNETKTQFHPLQLVNYVDYENEMDNPVEDKYRTLAHDLLRGLVDPA
ncbi:Phosphoinositide 3-kinase family, accessory domain (PIK domain) (Partial), partial [Seminavis robusta]|eukprot:Sro2393_g325870.1 Phosphoinositide 3-kinase family, accessory domain (PIK domain) (351) ;mRNA; f:14108-15160